MCVLQCTVLYVQYKRRHTVYMYGRVGHRGSTEARWPNDQGARVTVGKFERLLELILLRLGDRRALFGCMFLDIFAVSGPIFLKLTEEIWSRIVIIVHLIKKEKNQFPIEQSQKLVKLRIAKSQEVTEHPL